MPDGHKKGLRYNDHGFRYEEALADADSSASRRKLAQALWVFQSFREAGLGAPPLEDRTLFGLGRGPVPVDANYVTESEFIWVREQFAEALANRLGIVSPESRERLATIARLLVTLAYRCGLRRMEVAMLETRDVQLSEPAELLVRPTAMRRLKTKSATRKLPLAALLRQDELKALRRYVKKLRKPDHASSLLFAFTAEGKDYMPTEAWFDLLHRIMREETGDPTMRFHHLRHGFASRVHLWLAASAGGWAEQIGRFLPACAISSEEVRAFRKKLYGTANPTRKDVWAISSLLGHAGPDISLEHYLHHLDVALACELDQAGIAPSRQAIIAASGRSQAQAYRDLARWGDHHAWLVWLLGRRSQGEPSAASTAGEGKTPSGAALNKSTQIYELLRRASYQSKAIEDLAAETGIPADRIRAYLKSATWISQLRLAEGGRFRHRFETVGEGEESRRLLCPLKPPQADEHAMIERLWAGLREAYPKDPALVQRVVRHYVETAHPDFSGLIFPSPEAPEAARDFVRFLALCGCRKEEIQYVCFDVSRPRSTHAARWRQALKLHPTIKLVKRAPPNGRKDWACPWLGIQLVKPDPRGNRRASAALRFVLVMAAIAPDFEPDGPAGNA